MGWSHDSEKKSNAYNDQQMLERFVQVVNSQNEYNTNRVNAVPILIWHKIDNTNEEYATSMDLFEAEMKYLNDNGFIVLTMADLVYDESSNYLKISTGNDDLLIPNNKNDFAASVNSVGEDNSPDNAQSKEVRDDDAAVQEVTPTANDYGLTSEEEEDKAELTEPNYKSPQQYIDNKEDNDAEEDAENELPSAILRFLNEP